MPPMTGGQAVVATLKQEGVDTLFGINSVHMLPIYDALYDEPSLRLIVPRHEMAGGFMADAYSRASGKVGVYLTSTGPGAANSAGAILESWMGSTRTLQLTGQVDTPYLDQRRGVLHEAPDQPGMFTALGARTARVMAPADAPAALHEALCALRSQRPRPYVIEMPIDIQYQTADVALGLPLTPALPAPSPADVERAATLLLAARRPVVWAGGGINTSGAHAELRRVVEALGAPVFTTRGGRGALPDDHPLAVGNYFSEEPGRAFLEAADVVLAVGTRFSGSPTANWSLRLPPGFIRVDIDPAEVDHNYAPTLGIAADARLTLAALAKGLTEERGSVAPDYAAEVSTLRATLRAGIRARAPRIAALMDAITSAMPRETIVVTDATLPAYTGGNQYLPVRAERGFVTAHSVAIGAGLPFALGAQAAAPNRPVVCIAGDGGFMLHATELATAVEAGLPVVVCLFNNGGYGILRRFQRQRFGDRLIGVNLHPPDMIALAGAFGARAERVDTPAALQTAVARAIERRQVSLIDIQAPFEE